MLPIKIEVFVFAFLWFQKGPRGKLLIHKRRCSKELFDPISSFSQNLKGCEWEQLLAYRGTADNFMRMKISYKSSSSVYDISWLTIVIRGWDLQIKAHHANQNSNSEYDEEEAIQNNCCKMPLFLLRFLQSFEAIFLVKSLQNIDNSLDFLITVICRVSLDWRGICKTLIL